MGKWRRSEMSHVALLAVSLSIALILLFPAPLIAAAQAGVASTLPTPKISYSINGSKIIINTQFYNAELDASQGGIIYIKAHNDVNKEALILPLNTSVPMLSLNLLDNGTMIRLKNAQMTVEVKGNDTLALQLNYTYKNIFITQLIIFYRYTPFIETTVLYNGNIPLAIAVPASYNSTNTTLTLAYTYLYKKNLTTTIAIGNGSIPLPGLPMAFALVDIPKQNATAPKYVVAVKPYTTYNLKEIIINESKINNENNKLLYLVYYPTSNVSSISLAVAPTNYMPAVLSIPPFATTLSHITPIQNNLTVIDNINLLISKYENIINNYKKDINNLINRTNDIQKKLDLCNGKIDYYKQELKICKVQYSVVNKRLENTGRKEMGLFIFGVALGLIGGLFAIGKRK